MNQKRNFAYSGWFVALGLVCAAGFCLWQTRLRAARTDTPATSLDSVKSARLPSADSPDTGSQAQFPNAYAQSTNTWPAPQLRPLKVARQSLYFEWTGENAMATNVLERIAHNALEYQRLLEENTRIIRRQLVYRKEPIDMIIQRHRTIGMPINQLMVPGLDGQEFVVEVSEAELHPSGLEGALAGRLKGCPDSIVTLAFKGGREAFTVIAPAAGVYLQGDPREPGEIMVKSIDPATYTPGICGTP